MTKSIIPIVITGIVLGTLVMYWRSRGDNGSVDILPRKRTARNYPRQYGRPYPYGKAGSGK